MVAAVVIDTIIVFNRAGPNLRGLTTFRCGMHITLNFQTFDKEMGIVGPANRRLPTYCYCYNDAASRKPGNFQLHPIVAFYCLLHFTVHIYLFSIVAFYCLLHFTVHIYLFSIVACYCLLHFTVHIYLFSIFLRGCILQSSRIWMPNSRAFVYQVLISQPWFLTRLRAFSMIIPIMNSCLSVSII